MGKDRWNPWHGCHKCSEGCRNCYMFHMDALRERPEWSDTVFRTGKFRLPLMKNRQKQYKLKSGWRIMVNMTSDTFLEEARPWIPEFWSIIQSRPDLIFWLLTKRTQNITKMLPTDWNDGWDNVSLNMSIENQEAFDARWPVFSMIPAKHKGLCCAPLIGPLDITLALATGQIEEVAAGGENYDNPRICDLAWVKSLSDQCFKYQTNFCWYESGTRFRTEGHVRAWPKKADQGTIAYLSGLNHKFHERTHILRSPEDGHILTKEELWHPDYNLNHCTFCANRMLCNGCLDCGDCCQEPVHASLEQLWQAEGWLLENRPPLAYEIYCIHKERN